MMMQASLRNNSNHNLNDSCYESQYYEGYGKHGEDTREFHAVPRLLSTTTTTTTTVAARDDEEEEAGIQLNQKNQHQLDKNDLNNSKAFYFNNDTSTGHCGTNLDRFQPIVNGGTTYQQQICYMSNNGVEGNNNQDANNNNDTKQHSQMIDQNTGEQQVQPIDDYCVYHDQPQANQELVELSKQYQAAACLIGAQEAQQQQEIDNPTGPTEEIDHSSISSSHGNHISAHNYNQQLEQHQSGAEVSCIYHEAPIAATTNVEYAPLTYVPLNHSVPNQITYPSQIQQHELAEPQHGSYHPEHSFHKLPPTTYDRPITPAHYTTEQQLEFSQPSTSIVHHPINGHHQLSYQSLEVAHYTPGIESVEFDHQNHQHHQQQDYIVGSINPKEYQQQHHHHHQPSHIEYPEPNHYHQFQQLASYRQLETSRRQYYDHNQDQHQQLQLTASNSQESYSSAVSNSSDARSYSPTSSNFEASETESFASQLTRDERKAREAKIPLSYYEIVNMSIDQFNEQITKHGFTEAQLTLMKDIRRRGKNKVAAQTCRKRKMEQIIMLQHEVNHLKIKRKSLCQEKARLVERHSRLIQEYDRVYSLIKRRMQPQLDQQQQQQLEMS